MTDVIQVLDLETLALICSIVLGFITISSYGAFRAFKQLMIEIADVTNLANNAMQEVVVALDDDEVTEEEFKIIFNRMIAVYNHMQTIIASLAAIKPFGRIFAFLDRTESVSIVPFDATELKK